MSDITVGSVWVHFSGMVAIVDSFNGRYVDYHPLEKPDSKRSCSLPVFTKYFIEAKEDEPDMVNHPPHYKDNSPKAVQILNEAVAIMAERGKSYDKSGGEAERSMPKIVAMFNALTGHELTPEQGWKFMCCLKLARSEQGEYREDNYLDGAAYMALAGEEASEAADD